VVYFLVVQFVMALGALYEVAAWIVAGAVDPQSGLEFIGAQGDGWDAAKDMGLDVKPVADALLYE
jgi:putative membrane protein